MKKTISKTMDILIWIVIISSMIIFFGSIIAGTITAIVYDPYWIGIEIVLFGVVSPVVLMFCVWGLKLIKVSIVGTVDSVNKITDGIKEAKMNSIETEDIDFKREEELKEILDI